MNEAAPLTVESNDRILLSTDIRRPAAGRTRLAEERQAWRRMTRAVDLILAMGD